MSRETLHKEQDVMNDDTVKTKEISAMNFGVVEGVPKDKNPQKDPQENLDENLSNSETGKTDGGDLVVTTEMVPRTEEPEVVVTTEAYIPEPSHMIKTFCRYYIEQGCKNGSEAARRAGTTAKNPNQMAYQWLLDPWVNREVQKAREIIEKGGTPAVELVSEEDVVRKIEKVFLGSLNAEDYGTALKAAELLGKSRGMFAARSESLSMHKRIDEKKGVLPPDQDRTDQLIGIVKAQKQRNKIIDVIPTED